jgi:hypothetical protein
VTGEEYIARSFKICILSQYYSYDIIKNNEIGGVCGTYGRQERCIQGFGGET